MNTFLGVEGGGSVTEFVLIDETGQLQARHREGCAYYLETGMDELRALLMRGLQAVSAQAKLPLSLLTYAFVGLPAYGEDEKMLQHLDAAPQPALSEARYRCGNDMVCGWAGALACQDGINVVASTGSIAYGEYRSRRGRAGGWGELFGDEGSEYWVAREGLTAFARMSDLRSPKGPLHGLLKQFFDLKHDLELCAAIYGDGKNTRSVIARLATVVAAAARQGDRAAKRIFEMGAEELAATVDATRARLNVPAETRLPVSYSGSMFILAELVREPFERALEKRTGRYRCVAPRLTPAAGAALYAAKLHGTPLAASAVASLEQTCPASA
jgi:N-acetylglucosamine kinase-like BadF-type ATPase